MIEYYEAVRPGLTIWPDSLTRLNKAANFGG